MNRPTKPSRDYSTMPREEALRHFDNRVREINERIRTLPLAEKFRLVANFLEAGDAIAPAITLSVARLATDELERA